MLGEQGVLILGLVAEEREGLRVNSSSGDDFSAAAGNEIERGVVLEHAHGVGRAENGHGTRQANAAGLRSSRPENHGGGRDDKIKPVMLAEGEDIKARLVSEFCLR